MKKIIYTAMLASVLGLSSCIDSLNQEPIVESGAEDVIIQHLVANRHWANFMYRM